MVPDYPGGHSACQEFVVRRLRDHYANPAELPRGFPEIAERFWRKALAGADTLMRCIYSPFGPRPRPASCMLRSYLLSIAVNVPFCTDWVDQLRTVPAYAIPGGFEFGDTPGIGTFADFFTRLGADGVPVCMAGCKMWHDGIACSKYRSRFRCPLMHRKIAYCCCETPGSDSKFGRAVHLVMRDNPRLINIPPGDSEEWIQACNGRTSSERCNRRLKNDLKAGHYRSTKSLFSIFAYADRRVDFSSIKA